MTVKGFFEQKREWSRVKDRILSTYFPPYLQKLAILNRPLVLIDAFAGPGTFGSRKLFGSPMIIAEVAEQRAKGKYTAYFINQNYKEHVTLEKNLDDLGWVASTRPLLGDNRKLLPEIANNLNNETVFLYLDPYGLKDLDFNSIKPFLDRSYSYSTEILLNLCAPGLHRLAAHKTVQGENHLKDQIEKNHQILTRALGGDYWKDILLTNSGKSAEEREQVIVQEFMSRLSHNGYLKYTGACPIKEVPQGTRKYYMIFASRHKDAMLLFNDDMCKAYNEHMHSKQIVETPLFEHFDWTQWRSIKPLVDLVVSYTQKYNNRSRSEIWCLIVQDHFMKFTSKEYRDAVKIALQTGRIHISTQRPNNDSILTAA